MRTEVVKPLLACVALVVFCAILLVLSGCGRTERALTSGAVVPAAQLPLGGFRSDTAYAVVRVDALPLLNDTFRSVLFDVSRLSKWDARYDCNHFAALYIAVAQAKFAAAAWHSNTPAQTLALAEVWYRPDRSTTGHAIVAAVTDRGLVYIEPQTGHTIVLSNTEDLSRYFTRW